ncbi:4-alpha-glucanotransferase [Akkermansiaceae bacterium]|nr:4-alpha-glucanotransferase [Akkermansiaceae bacterium]
MKTTGLLIPAFSTRIHGDLGIGDTAGMRHWIDWAAAHGIGFLQLLPINENGTDESPYSGISSIALDPIYLSFGDGEIPFLTRAETDAARNTLGAHVSAHLIDYPSVRAAKNHLLEISFARFMGAAESAPAAEFLAFRDRSAAWLPDYCLFRLLMEIHGEHLSWDQWPEESRCPDSARRFAAALRARNPGHIESRLDRFAYVQWLCFRQWRAVRAHADLCGVKLMGDLPIGVSFHSADVFFHRAGFHTNWFGGTPPEGYSSENPFIHEWGQNWGVPLYDWDAMAQDGFSWWRERISRLTEIFNMFRIDHILGFYRIYGFPWHPRDNHRFLGLGHGEAADLTDGRLPRWFIHADDSHENKATNLANGDFRLRAILDAAGDAEIIAEDLGWVPEYVRPHLGELGIAGYRIPHWDSYQDGSPVMGNVFPQNSFASYSTHDHDSLCATWENCRKTILIQHENPTEQGHWAAEGAAHALRLLAGFSGIPIPAHNDWPPYSDAIHWRLIKTLLESNSRYAVLMVTDLFALRDRINTPGTAGAGNWRLRLNISSHEMAEHGRILANLISVTGRKPHAALCPSPS